MSLSGPLNNTFEVGMEKGYWSHEGVPFQFQQPMPPRVCKAFQMEKRYCDAPARSAFGTTSEWFWGKAVEKWPKMFILESFWFSLQNFG